MAKETEKTQYHEAVGRRKTATARVRVFAADKNQFSVNDQDISKYFPTVELVRVAKESLQTSEIKTPFKITVKVSGGGIHAQAEAIRHGVSRVLVALDAELRTKLKKAGFLKRDPRVKERRKFGLKKARKAPQWSKR